MSRRRSPPGRARAAGAAAARSLARTSHATRRRAPRTAGAHASLRRRGTARSFPRSVRRARRDPDAPVAAGRRLEVAGIAFVDDDRASVTAVEDVVDARVRGPVDAAGPREPADVGVDEAEAGGGIRVDVVDVDLAQGAELDAGAPAERRRPRERTVERGLR